MNIFHIESIVDDNSSVISCADVEVFFIASYGKSLPTVVINNKGRIVMNICSIDVIDM